MDVWCEDVLDRLPDSPVPPVATEIVAVRDLDLIGDDRWPQALALLAQPPLRDAITQQMRILLPDGTHEVVRPYTAWWLRGHPVLDGRRPAGLLAAGGDPLLRGLYDEADATGFGDEQVLRALGVRTSVAALLDEPGGAAELLDRLADPDREVSGAQLHALYGALADLDPEQVTLPDELRAVVDGEVRVVDAADAVVVDSPDLLAFTDGVPLLPVRPARARSSPSCSRCGGSASPSPARSPPRAPSTTSRTPYGCCWGGDARLVPGARGTRRGRDGVGLARHPRRCAARRHRGGGGRRARLVGGPVAAPFRGRRAPGGPVPHRGTGPGPLVRLSRPGPIAYGVGGLSARPAAILVTRAQNLHHPYNYSPASLI